MAEYARFCADLNRTLALTPRWGIDNATWLHPAGPSADSIQAHEASVKSLDVTVRNGIADELSPSARTYAIHEYERRQASRLSNSGPSQRASGRTAARSSFKYRKVRRATRNVRSSGDRDTYEMFVLLNEILAKLIGGKDTCVMIGTSIPQHNPQRYVVRIVGQGDQHWYRRAGSRAGECFDSGEHARQSRAGVRARSKGNRRYWALCFRRLSDTGEKRMMNHRALFALLAVVLASPGVRAAPAGSLPVRLGGRCRLQGERLPRSD